MRIWRLQRLPLMEAVLFQTVQSHLLVLVLKESPREVLLTLPEISIKRGVFLLLFLFIMDTNMLVQNLTVRRMRMTRGNITNTVTSANM